MRGTFDWSSGGTASLPGVDERLSSIAIVLEPVWTTTVSSNVRIDGPRRILTSPGKEHSMKRRTIQGGLCMAAILFLSIPATASAASLRLRCETRTDPLRSKISVDGRNVMPNALYSARVISGTNQATAGPRVAVGDEVEFDFDSDRGDIRNGAKAIAPNFIRNHSVRAAIFNASGQVVAGPKTATCESH